MLASSAAESGSVVVDGTAHFQPHRPHRLAGILLREHDEDLTGSAASWPPL